jgi:CheY-like chemotaxis protein
VDLIVSDLSMPGMDGLALIRAAQLRRPGLTAILLTGFADMDAAAVAVDGSMSGTFSLLRKPIDGKLLNERVAVLLERAAGRRGC